MTRLGAEQPVDDPGLPAQLGRPPAGGRRDVRERRREHENPEHPARPVQVPRQRKNAAAAHRQDNVPRPTMMW